jgi:hypothetical protein
VYLGSDHAVNTDEWLLIETHIVRHATAGVMQLKLNGTMVEDHSGLALGTVNPDSFNVGSQAFTDGGGTTTLYVDDAACSLTGWIGPGKSIVRSPASGTPQYDAWTKSTGSDAYALWNDTPFNAGDYCVGDTNNTQQTAHIAAFDATQSGHGSDTIAAADTINAVKVGMVAKRSNGGATTHEIRRRVNSVDTDTAISLTTADLYYEEGTYWTDTLTNLNGMEAGGDRGSGGRDFQIEDLWVFVDYSPADNAKNGSVVLPGGGSYTLAATHDGNGTLTNAGGGSLLYSASKQATGPLTLAGGGTFIKSGSKQATSPIVWSGGGTIVPLGTKNGAGSMILSGGGAHVLLGTKGGNATITLPGGGTLVAAATHDGHVILSLPGGGTIVATGSKGTDAKNGSVILSGGGTQVVLGTHAGHGTYVLTGGGTQTMVGRKSASDTITIPGGGTLVPLGTKGANGTLVLPGGGTIVYTGSKQGHGVNTLSGGGVLAGLGTHAGHVSLTLPGGGTLTLTGTKGGAGGPSGFVILNGGGLIVPQGSKGASDAVAIPGGGLIVPLGLRGPTTGSVVIPGGGSMVLVTKPHFHGATVAFGGNGTIQPATGHKGAVYQLVLSGGGDPSVPYTWTQTDANDPQVDLTDLSVQPYIRGSRPNIPSSMPGYLDDELQRIQDSLTDLVEAAPQVANAPPEEPRRGTIRFAVAPWDPGSGSDKWYTFDGASWILM